MRIEEKLELDFDDVLILPKRSEHGSRKDVLVKRHFKFKYSPIELNCTPIIAANMDSTGTIEMSKSLSKLGCLTALHKFYPNEVIGPHLKEFGKSTFYTLGIREQDRTKFLEYIKTYGQPELICIDVPNAYLQTFVEYCAWVRSQCPFSVIMAGNCVCSNMTGELVISGKVDIVKVGIGPGRTCQTRIVTGVGRGQLTTIDECGETVRGLHAHICADGGMKNSGDVCKGLGAGADFVMLGSMMAGSEECDGDWQFAIESGKKYWFHERTMKGNRWDEGFEPNSFNPTPYRSVVTHNKDLDGQIILKPKKIALKFHGMSSQKAMEKHYGKMDDYKSAEGEEIEVPYKGPVENVTKQILGGIRSCCTYIGAKGIFEMPKCTTFTRINRIK